MNQVRHWKQTFDPRADFVFRKRMVLNCCGVDTTAPGDPVTDELRQAFGNHRLKVWWRGGFIELAPEREDAPDEEIQVTATGKGWFTVTYPDGTTKRVRGREKAEALANGDD